MTRIELDRLKEKLKSNKNKAERFANIKFLIEELPTVPTIAQFKEFLKKLKNEINS